MICLHLRPVACPIRQIKCALSNHNINSRSGQEEISGRRMDPTGAFPTGASIMKLSAGSAAPFC